MDAPEDRPLRDEPGRRDVAARRTVHHGMVWDIVRDTIDFAPGVRFDREYVHHTGAVAVLAVDERDRMLLIRQYRHPAGETLWEIPAGLLDVGGEAASAAALRELREETGHDAQTVQTLLDFRPSPGGSDEVIRIYLVTGVRAAVEDGFVRTDEEAELEVRWAGIDEVARAVLAGDLTSGSLVAGVLALVGHRALGAPLRGRDTPWPERPGHGTDG
ncbi:NUDIX hydrolase [Brachybacterium huguangmaarense]|uniref:NUDIX hydrolase n=1 Tax=Brachybacterium huguangmaarense TaxID=1652028 RepID=A0ABY6G031_9MICO|nr:NUDIX hydrolase [Brachybacterium huguangmaarense]UYG16551.1 NUDIX hydrolase [Brachybacterium huguangmaarense]